jgi:hypothetical protein
MIKKILQMNRFASKISILAKFLNGCLVLFIKILQNKSGYEIE